MVVFLVDWYPCLVALVDSLVAKTRTWEEERGMSFMYDGVPLLAMLDEYAILRHEREEEKRRLRVSPYIWMHVIWDINFFGSITSKVLLGLCLMLAMQV